MRWPGALLVLLSIGILFVACVDLNFTLRAPCATYVIHDPAGDTLYRILVDSTACPKSVK